MHEVGIIESTLAVVRREAEARQAARIERVVIRVGVLSGAEPDALRFAFEACSPGTVADGAELDIEVVPALAHCRTCARDFTAGSGVLCQCPDCGAFSGDLRSGRELELRRIEFTPLIPSTP